MALSDTKLTPDELIDGLQWAVNVATRMERVDLSRIGDPDYVEQFLPPIPLVVDFYRERVSLGETPAYVLLRLTETTLVSLDIACRQPSGTLVYTN